MSIDDRVNGIVDAGVAVMVQRRGQRGRRVKRSMRRKAKWGDKKKAVQIGAGVLIGAGAVTASILTAGAAAAIAGIAVGGYALSQAIALGTNRAYLRGKPKQASWLNKVNSNDFRNRSDTDQAKYLDGKAHLTARRALVHWRKARKGLGQVQQKNRELGRDGANCSDAVGFVCAKMYFSHHLYKTRLYLLPSLFLADLSYEVYTKLDAWAGTADQQLRSKLRTFLAGPACQGTGPCYHSTGSVRPVSAPAAAAPVIAEFTDMLWAQTELSALKDQLQRDIDAPRPFKQVGGALGARLDTLYADAACKYDSPAVGTKLKRSVTNWGARRTKREKVIFGVGQGLQVASTSGGGVFDGLGPQLSAGMNVLAAAIQTTAEIGADEVLDVIGDRDREGDAATVDSGSGAKKGSLAKLGKTEQDLLRTVAVHLSEACQAQEAAVKASSGELETCEDWIELLHYVAKVRHHLSRVTDPLASLHAILKKVSEDTVLLISMEPLVWEQGHTASLALIDGAAQEHAQRCNGYQVCYGPRNLGGAGSLAQSPHKRL